MKQKCQAKQNTKKKLKETLNWTSSGETVAPDAPVTLHRSNRLSADTPVPYHQCIGPCNGLVWFGATMLALEVNLSRMKDSMKSICKT